MKFPNKTQDQIEIGLAGVLPQCHQTNQEKMWETTYNKAISTLAKNVQMLYCIRCPSRVSTSLLRDAYGSLGRRRSVTLGSINYSWLAKDINPTMTIPRDGTIPKNPFTADPSPPTITLIGRPRPSKPLCFPGGLRPLDPPTKLRRTWIL